MIQKFDETYTSTNAQDAADFISAKYKDANDNLTTDQTTVLESAELLNQIAAAVDDVTVTKSMKADTGYDLAEGYWLFVTDGTSVDVDEDGTSPIFALCSGGLITIVEKTSLPTVDKVVLNDADGADWTYGAEAERGQSVSHKITGTVASNIKTYDLYYYEFEDVMSKGIQAVIHTGHTRATVQGLNGVHASYPGVQDNADMLTRDYFLIRHLHHIRHSSSGQKDTGLMEVQCHLRE